MAQPQGAPGATPGEDAREAGFDALVREKGREPGALIPLLQAAQETYGFISEPAMEYISGVTGIPVAEIYGVVTFYTQFRTRPLGKYLIRVCNGTACHVNGSTLIEQTAADELQAGRGETTADGLFTLESVACIGCCSLAPVLMVNDDTHGSLNPAKTRKILREYRKRS